MLSREAVPNTLLPEFDLEQGLHPDQSKPKSQTQTSQTSPTSVIMATASRKNGNTRKATSQIRRGKKATENAAIVVEKAGNVESDSEESESDDNKDDEELEVPRNVTMDTWDETEQNSELLKSIAVHNPDLFLPGYIKQRILSLEELDRKTGGIADDVGKYEDVVHENTALKRKVEELETAKKLLEMGRKKKKTGQLSPEQRQLLSEASQTVSNVVCRQVKFPPKGWQGWSEDKNSVCMMILPTLSFPPGATLTMKKEIYMEVIAPALGRMMTQSRNRITQPMKKTFMRECSTFVN